MITEPLSGKEDGNMSLSLSLIGSHFHILDWVIVLHCSGGKSQLLVTSVYRKFIYYQQCIYNI
jgi:hypothetical protein